jgi:leucyl aminopeptidase
MEICFAEGGDSLPLHIVTPAGLAAAPLAPAQRAYCEACGFTGQAQRLILLPALGGDGGSALAGAVLGLGDGPVTPMSFGGLALGLPEGSLWHLADHAHAAAAVLGWGLGAYRYGRFKPAKRAPARLVLPGAASDQAALAQLQATNHARDLINTPANALGPAELAAAVGDVAARHGAKFRVIEGAALAEGFPAVQAVGGGSPRAPRIAILEWGAADAPLLALCGKGVCFDTGGLDLKPPSAMLRMKKDMGGAAVMLALADCLMAARAPWRILLVVGAVENSVSGEAFRPGDVIATRAGLSVEIGNTDAEGRLVLADLLSFAGEHSPALILNGATLTGAARVALGPDLPALFANDEALADALLRGGAQAHDPLWRLPLHDGYDSWLDSGVADLNNISSKPSAGAVVAALFLRRFVPVGTPWAHLDLYAWNDANRPGRPEGGEATGLRAIQSGLTIYRDSIR